MIISASIMCADLTNLEKECLKLELADIDRIHFDIMDGNFVPNIVLGFSFLKDLRAVTNLPFEAHLMTIEPEKYLDVILNYDIQFVCIHIESSNHISEIIDRVKAAGKKIGIVLKPKTPISEVLPYLELVDMITFMTVEPGFAGQPFKPEVLNKIKELSAIINSRKLNIEIQTDGNMSEETIPLVVKNGTDSIIAGTSCLFKKDINYRDAVKMIHKWVE